MSRRSDYDDIPAEVLARAKLLTLDFLGSTIRARRDAESTPSLLKMLQALSLDGPGDLPPCSATTAAGPRRWRRCSTARSAIRWISTIPTPIPRCIPRRPVVPAAFAVGEMVGASGRDVLDRDRRRL